MIRRLDRPEPRPRRGLTSVIMLIGLLVLGIVAANLIRVERTRLDRARADERALQLASLADAGLDRALVHLRADPRFEGETWEPTSADLGGAARARVTIAVRPDSTGRADAVEVAVAAELILGPDRSIRQTRTLPVIVPPRRPQP